MRLKIGVDLLTQTINLFPLKYVTALLLLPHMFYAQEAELDSIKHQVETYTKRDSTRVKLLIDLTKYYSTRDINQNRLLIDEAIQISEEIGYEKGKGYSLNALTAYHTIKGQYDTALTHALRAKALLEGIGDKENLIFTHGNLARIYSENQKYDKALAIHLENIELVKDNPSSSSKAGFYYYVGKTYQELKEYEKAEQYFLRALEISKEVDFATGIAIAEGGLGTIYNYLGRYKEALVYLNKILEFSRKYKQETNEAGALFSLADSYQGVGNFQKALECNTGAMTIYEGLQNYKMLKHAYSQQAQYLEKLNRYKEATDYWKKHLTMVDSVFSENKIKTIEDLQAKYETEKKETEIASLSQQAAIQVLEIQQKNQTIIIGFIFFLFISLTTFFIYKHRSLKRQKVQTELEQRFLRSQLNPHFISNALLAVQQFMLTNQAEKAALYLAKFSKLMREILENSRQEFIPVEDELRMLSNFMDIHKMRLNDSFDYTIELPGNIDPEADTIPPMFVQPFVENAIEHGIVNAAGKGKICVKFFKEEDYISIEIEDNGGGLAKSNSRPTSNGSLSTAIIKERMELFNLTLKKKIEFILDDITNDEGKVLGTRVELKVPFGYI